MKFENVYIDGSGSIVNPDISQDIKDEIRSHRGKHLDITIELHKEGKKRRSLDQNAYWWAVPVKMLAEHCGYTPSQMHYALLGECFGYVTGPIGEAVPKVASSSQLTTVQFKELIDWVLVWASSQLEVHIPAPDEWREAA